MKEATVCFIETVHGSSCLQQAVNMLKSSPGLQTNTVSELSGGSTATYSSADPLQRLTLQPGGEAGRAEKCALSFYGIEPAVVESRTLQERPSRVVECKLRHGRGVWARRPLGQRPLGVGLACAVKTVCQRLSVHLKSVTTRPRLGKATHNNTIKSCFIVLIALLLR